MQIDPSTLIFTIINFVVLMVLLNRFLFKPVLTHMADRQRRIDAGLSAGQQSLDELAQIQRTLQEEAKAQRALLQQQGDERLRRAQDEAASQREAHGADLRRRRDEAILALRDEQADLSHELSLDLPSIIDRLNQKIDPENKGGA